MELLSPLLNLTDPFIGLSLFNGFVPAPHKRFLGHGYSEGVLLRAGGGLRLGHHLPPARRHPHAHEYHGCRLVTQGGKSERQNSKHKYNNISQTIKTVWREEGWRGFYRGIKWSIQVTRLQLSPSPSSIRSTFPSITRSSRPSRGSIISALYSLPCLGPWLRAASQIRSPILSGYTEGYADNEDQTDGRCTETRF